MLEPDAGKLARTVLRGGSASNGDALPEARLQKPGSCVFVLVRTDSFTTVPFLRDPMVERRWENDPAQRTCFSDRFVRGRGPSTCPTASYATPLSGRTAA